MSPRKVRLYVQTHIEWRARARQLEAHPELRTSARFMRELEEARIAKVARLRTLTGGELGLATRMIADEDAARAARLREMDEPTTTEEK